jgi:O-antigen/teichoic acid export membrane protein
MGMAQFGRNTIYNLSSSVIGLAVTVLTVPVYIHVIGEARYGAMAIVWLFLGYFSLFDLGLSRATANKLAQLQDAPASERESVFWTAVYTNVFIGLVGGAVLWIALNYFAGTLFASHPELAAELRAGLPWLAAGVPVVTMTGVLVGALDARGKFLHANAIQTILAVLFQTAPLLVAVFWGPYLPWLIAAAVTMRLLGMVPLGYFCVKYVPIAKVSPINWTTLKTLFSYGGWVTVSNSISPIMTSIDQFIISALAGPAAVAAYSVPFSVVNRVLILPAAFSRALFPQMSKSTEDEAQEIARRAATRTTLLMTLICAPAILLVGPALHLWIPTMADASTPIARLLLFGVWFNGVATVPFSLLQARRRPDLVAKVHLMEIIPFLAIVSAMIYWFGAPGAAIAWSVRTGADAILLNMISGWKAMPSLSALISAASLAFAFSLSLVFADNWFVLFGFASLIFCTNFVFLERSMPFASKIISRYQSRH